ncbi:hypothetical protein QQY66_24615 [Streptomyces sp. DG2A-72]|uniref:hypothetical protein n=1 Tax=Streptomyces sp. DG2A-72 TaxID=3051386 RepID=UPI00265C0FA8|nr:hypothetical protein [Streptomyces sp. DG2A-72]MDO0934708.1 hypothetical protein [Streptomyces sp. DG2A-72]
MNRHLRRVVVVTAALTAGLAMTACQNGSANNGSANTGSSQHKSSSKKSGTSKTSKHSNSSASAQNAAGSSQRGVSGTVTGGTVSYLAPGKYTVHMAGKTDQAFFVADDTAVYGAGAICGSPRSEARPSCTLDQLETATKKAAVTADVTLKNGVATVVRERHDVENGTGTTGVNGTWFGNVGYLAPGKFTVSDMKGVEQAFFVSDSTRVYGAGTICGTPRSEETPQCTLTQLESAAKKGVSAKVEIRNGVATTVTEDR